jgi:outer membrane immunogenic protein
MVYALGGYGGNRYRLAGTAPVADAHQWGSSFVVGGGAEYALRRGVGVRLDMKHVDNQTWQLMLGVPLRF